ncbi:MAG: cell division protein FtsA [Bacilli bacterium]
MKKIMASLDVDGDTIKLVVGEMIKKRLKILAVAETPTFGVKKGLVVNPDELVDALQKVFERCEEIIGLPIKKVIVTVPCDGAEFTLSEGKTDVINADNTITGADIIRVLQASVKGQVPDNMELISLMPTVFKLDNGELVKNPKKMISSILSVKSVVITAPKKTVYPVLACLEKLGIDVLDLSFGSIGDYYEHVNATIDKQVGIIVNMGEDITTVSAFNKGVLINTKIIDLGGINIDNDLAYVFKLTKNDAKMIKEKLALAHKRMAQANSYEMVTNKDGEEVKLNQYEVTEVVQSRLSEILNLIKREINLLTKKEISYIIFTGALTEMKDFSLILEEIYGKNVTLGRVNEIGVRNNKYSSCVGMIKYYASKAKLKDKDFSIFSIEEQEELSGLNKKINVSDEGILGKLFGYFFDN